MHALFKSLAWLEPVIELARLAVFAIFVALVVAALIAAVRRAPDTVLRRRANLLVGYVLVITSLTGVTQVDAWPFTTWALVHTLRSPLMHSYELEAADATGQVYAVDPRILQPMATEEFGAWVGNLQRLPPAARTDVARFLWRRAEDARRAFRNGAFPSNDWLLGRFSAPYHFQARNVWKKPADVPSTPFISLRIVFTEWNLEERYRVGSSAIRRRVIAEYRPDA